MPAPRADRCPEQRRGCASAEQDGFESVELRLQSFEGIDERLCLGSGLKFPRMKPRGEPASLAALDCPECRAEEIIGWQSRIDRRLGDGRSLFYEPAVQVTVGPDREECVGFGIEGQTGKVGVQRIQSDRKHREEFIARMIGILVVRCTDGWLRLRGENRRTLIRTQVPEGGCQTVSDADDRKTSNACRSGHLGPGVPVQGD